MATKRDFVVKKGLKVAEGITLGGHTFDDIDIGSEFVDTDDHIMSSGAIKEYVDANAGGDTNAGGVDGSAGSPTFSFTNDNDTGFYLDGVNTIGVSMGGSRKFRMYADTFRMDGTTNPQVIKCDSASVDLELRSGGGTYGKIHIGRENQDIEITPAGTGEVVLAGASKANKISVVAITGTTTLTDAQSGSYVYVTGSGAPTLPATAEIGQQYTIINNTGSDLTPGLGTSNSSIPSSHTAISDDAARTYVAVAANTWFFVG